MSDTEPFVTVGVRFPRPVRATIEGAAAAVGMTVSEWVRMAAYRQLDAPPTLAEVADYRGKVVKSPVTNGKDPRGTLKKGVAVGRGPAPTRPPAPVPAPPLARREVSPIPKTGKVKR